MSEKQNQAEVQWRTKILKWLFLMTSIFSLYLSILSAYTIFQYTKNGYTLTDLRPLIVQSSGSVIVFIVSLVSVFLYRRKVSLFSWIFPILFMVWMGFDLSQSLWSYIAIPIIFSAFIIKPAASLLFAALYSIEVLIVLYLNQSLPTSVNDIVTGLLPVFIIEFVFGIVAFLVSRELFTMFLKPSDNRETLHNELVKDN